MEHIERLEEWIVKVNGHYVGTVYATEAVDGAYDQHARQVAIETFDISKDAFFSVSML